MRGVHLLNVLYLSNQARKDPLPNSEFYSKSVSQQADLAHEYIVWHRLLVSPCSTGPTHMLWSIMQPKKKERKEKVYAGTPVRELMLQPLRLTKHAPTTHSSCIDPTGHTCFRH